MTRSCELGGMTPTDRAEILVNPSREHGAASQEREAGAVLAFHRRLPGYEPTALVDAPSLASGLGLGRLHVKNETRRLGLPSFKILGASWATYCLLVDRLGREPEWRDLDELRAELRGLGGFTLAAATDGNHGRAVARVARLLGYRAHILVPRNTVPARIEAIAGEGAQTTVVDGTYDDAVAVSASLAADDVLVISDTSWPGYVDTPAHVIDGYATIFAEVDQQLGAAAPDVVVVQMGVGALAAAVVAHYANVATVVVVEPRSAACGLRSAEAGEPVVVPGPHDSIMAGLNCGTVSVVAWPTVARGVDIFVAVDDGMAETAMRDLATVGLTAGETGGAGLAGLRALVDAGVVDPRGRRVLVLCTEGATDPSAFRRIVGQAP
jgi:diaminopropionate ammonia-lyase